jgi:hypothetical protein
MSKTTQQKYLRIYSDYQMYSGTEVEFCKKAKITRRTLDRAIAYNSALRKKM